MDPLPPAEVAVRYVEYMGGSDSLLEKAEQAYRDGDYRWVVEVVNHLVFADPQNQRARELQANALEQLGYQSESGQWRNFYLTGASELRNGVVTGGFARTLSEDMISALTLEMIFDYLAVRLNGPEATGNILNLEFRFTDTGEQHWMNVSNGVLHHGPGRSMEAADATIVLTRSAFISLILLNTPPEQLQAAGMLQVEGNQAALTEYLRLLDKFEFWFNIVTP